MTVSLARYRGRRALVARDSLGAAELFSPSRASSQARKRLRGHVAYREKRLEPVG